MILPVFRIALSYLALDGLAQPQPAELADFAPSPAQKQAYLNVHNTVRRQHDTPALAWNDKLSNKAAEWGRRCVFHHS